MAAVFHFDEASHVYTLDGEPIPSVTQLLRPIAPDFSAVPPDVLERKRALGTAVHLACELDDLGELGDCDAELLPYLSAWRRYRAESGAEVVANERQLYHPALRYAGTLDRLCMVDGEAWLVDLKTSADPLPSYGVQLAGYAELLAANAVADGGPIHRATVNRATVHLRADGTYRLHRFTNPNDRAVFFGLLSIHAFKESNK